MPLAEPEGDPAPPRVRPGSGLLRPLPEDYTSGLSSCSRGTETLFLQGVWCSGLPVTGLHTRRRKQKLKETLRIPLCSVPACSKILTSHRSHIYFLPVWSVHPAAGHGHAEDHAGL